MQEQCVKCDITVKKEHSHCVAVVKPQLIRIIQTTIKKMRTQHYFLTSFWWCRYNTLYIECIYHILISRSGQFDLESTGPIQLIRHSCWSIYRTVVFVATQWNTYVAEGRLEWTMFPWALWLDSTRTQFRWTRSWLGIQILGPGLESIGLCLGL